MSRACAEHCFHRHSGAVWMTVRPDHVLEKCCNCDSIRQVHQEHVTSKSHRQIATWAIAMALIGSCVRLDHIPPQPRRYDTERTTMALVQVSCSEPNPFNDPDLTAGGNDPDLTNPAAHNDPDIVWVPPGGSSGVVISERHILIAAHQVRCPIIPKIRATIVVNGESRTFQMDVTRDEGMFGDGRDMARLEISSADRFHLDVPPPLLFSVAEPRTPPHGELCAHLPNSGRISCGVVDWDDYTILRGMVTHPGDSGSPIYDDHGRLVGLVTGGNGVDTKMILISPDWLEGT